MNSSNFPDAPKSLALTRPSGIAHERYYQQCSRPRSTRISRRTRPTRSGSPVPDFSPDTTTSNDGEDSGAATGFSIANEYDYFESSIWQRTGSGKSLRIAINGENTINTPATASIAISGMARVGQTLTSTTSDLVDPNGLPANASDYSLQWIRIDGPTQTPISGATGLSYTLVAADAGKRLKVRVSFTDGLDFAEMHRQRGDHDQGDDAARDLPNAFSLPTGRAEAWTRDRDGGGANGRFFHGCSRIQRRR